MIASIASLRCVVIRDTGVVRAKERVSRLWSWPRSVPTLQLLVTKERQQAIGALLGLIGPSVPGGAALVIPHT